VTLLVGWLVWSVIVWGRGQTPGKQLLGMVVARKGTRYAAGRGTMFLREVVAKSAVGYLPAAVAAVVPTRGLGVAVIVFLPALAVARDAWLLWDRYNQEPWDKIAVTIVVDDPFRRLVASPAARVPDAATAPTPSAAPPMPQVPLSRVALNRAVHYLNARKFEVGLRLLEQSVVDAQRHGDRAAIERAARILTQIRPRLPRNLLYLADEIARTTRRRMSAHADAGPAREPPR